jgi:hypothetical protein
VGADSIGKTAGIMVPGRVEAEDYFRAKGIDTLSIFDTARVVTDIHDSDWFDFVLDILGSEAYTCRIKVSDPVANCKIYLLVDEVLTDSVLVNANTDTLEVPLYLHKGKHALKLLFSYPDSSIDLMKVDWIDLYGEISYYTITASSSEGGSIEPDGIFYLAAGDSMEFAMDWELYFQPEGLRIDGEIQNFAETYTFRNISNNHRIEAIFTGCSGTQLNPYIQVNDEDSLNTSDITVTEGDQVILGLEYEDPGELTWLGPGGKTGRGRTLVLENIQTYQEGIYTAFLTNSAGCKNKQDFGVAVEPFVLEVYEAERWTAKSGVINDICRDVGGGQHLGYIDDSDWSSYQVEIDRTGMYEVIARVATGTEGGEIELSVDDEILCSIPVSGALSDGWQDWYTTSPLELPLEGGKSEIKLTFKGGEGYLFNLNWFDLSFNRSLLVSKPEIAEDPSMDLRCYQLPGRSGIGIKYGLDTPSDVHISIVNLSGVSIRTFAATPNQGPGFYDLSWDGKDDAGSRVKAGIYFVVFRSKNRKEVEKVLYFP